MEFGTAGGRARADLACRSRTSSRASEERRGCRGELPTPTFGRPAGGVRRLGWRAHHLPHGGVLPRGAASFRRAHGRPRPAGGKWNHDHANREPPPRGATLGVDGAVAVAARGGRCRRRSAGRPGPHEPADRRPRRSAAGSPSRGRGAEGVAALRDRRLPHSGRTRTRCSPPTGRWRTRCSPCRSTSACSHPFDAVRAAEDAHRAGAVSDRESGGVRPAGAGVARVRLAAVLALGRGYLRRNALHARTPLPDWWRALDGDA